MKSPGKIFSRDPIIIQIEKKSGDHLEIAQSGVQAGEEESENECNS